ncbi:MAG TPA: hypothetical protein DCS07_17880 [Bdellovibrionales bacterium]|nr:MAG: hypothetical protein A2Z97_05395 [Bdellovibrionales bacterium GWB1_52_6]OFZ05705.1 MAG: hypothetical protein A2X97_03300 [Bdellovibrionales bacterium GWA1_52_35]HAR44472.1 hypothetical protein [Bdellovibrionales bacterium]HCM40358.1 hypothetical protein [Bdellovibrionales bacterium]
MADFDPVDARSVEKVTVEPLPVDKVPASWKPLLPMAGCPIVPFSKFAFIVHANAWPDERKIIPNRNENKVLIYFPFFKHSSIMTGFA